MIRGLFSGVFSRRTHPEHRRNYLRVYPESYLKKEHKSLTHKLIQQIQLYKKKQCLTILNNMVFYKLYI